jgi:hypothetical protein
VSHTLKLLRIVLVVVLALVVGLCTAYAQSHDKRLIIIVVPGLRADDLTRPELPTLRKLVANGAIGWMNTRTARVPGQKRDPIAAAYITLNAGARATAGPYAMTMTPDALSRLKSENSKLDHSVQIGALGDMLASQSIDVVGSDDVSLLEGPKGRPLRVRKWRMDMDSAVRLLMDSTGRLSSHASFGGGRYVQCYAVPYLEEVDREAALCLPAVAAANRTEALRVTFEEILEVLSSDSTKRSVLLSPVPADSAPDGDRLAPILMFGDGVKPGLLTSASTRTPGLVTNTDFVPTVVDYFGLQTPPGMVGRPMTVVPLAPPGPSWWIKIKQSLGLAHSYAGRQSAPTPELWADLHDRWYARASQQSALGGMPTVQFVLVLVGTALGIAAQRTMDHGRWTIKTQSGMVHGPWSMVQKGVLAPAAIVAALPLLLLVLPQVSPSSVAGAAMLLTVLVLALVLVVALRHQTARPIVFSSLAALSTIIPLDLLTGSHILREAWMSYSVMEGARYYGIGNEYAAAVFAASLVTAGAALSGSRLRRWPTALILLMGLAVLIGLPHAGADAGGLLSAAVGFMTAALVWWSGRLRAREVLLALVAVAAVLAVVLVSDLLRAGSEQSHIGRAITGGDVLNIISRKVALNGYLLLHSPWSLALLAGLGGIVLLLRSHDSGLYRMLQTDQALRGAATGLVAGTVALLLFNDSGVVAAAEALLLTWSAAMALCLTSPGNLAEPPGHTVTDTNSLL